MKDQDREKAEHRLAQTLGTTVGLWSRLQRFYNIARSGLDSGVNQQILAESFLTEPPDETLAKYWCDPDDAQEFVRVLKSAKIRQRTLDTSQSIIDAACVVFAHGILESCVYEYLKVTAIALPEQWECYVKRKKVELTTLKNVSFEQIRSDKIDNFLKTDVKRESLLDKLDRLHRIAPPGDEVRQMPMSYDRKRLVMFDKARQRIVHGTDWSSYSFDFAKESLYWNWLNWYFSILVQTNTGLRLSTRLFGQSLRDLLAKN